MPTRTAIWGILLIFVFLLLLVLSSQPTQLFTLLRPQPIRPDPFIQLGLHHPPGPMGASRFLFSKEGQMKVHFTLQAVFLSMPWL